MIKFSNKKKYFSDYLWDLWCVTSVVGIWPRFIEPNIITTSDIPINIAGRPEEHKGLKIIQLSDLHLHPGVPNHFLSRLLKKIKTLNPDMIVITGDFLCLSTTPDPERLINFLKQLKATYGCYAILGNHDYNEKIGINIRGQYDVFNQNSSMIGKGFSRLFNPVYPIGEVTPEAKSIPINPSILRILEKTTIHLLHNQTTQIDINGAPLNLCGLGEYTLGRCQPDLAFANYDTKYPGIILSHNPDSLPLLKNYPGDMILCGHTHGAQVDLPFIWKRLNIMENPTYKRGLFKVDNKWMYVSRGLGSTMPFRWFSLPEIVVFRLL